MRQHPDVLTLRQAAALMGTTAATAQAALEQGLLEPAGIPSGSARRRHLHLVTRRSVEALAAERKANPPRPGVRRGAPRFPITDTGPGLSVPEAARLLGKSRAWVYRLMAQGRLRVCDQRPYRVSLASLQELRPRATGRPKKAKEAD